MAVYERTYRIPTGDRTPEWSRFLIIPRYAYQQVFGTKAFIAFLVVCFLFPLFVAVAMYLPHNLKFLQAFEIDPRDIAEWVNNWIFPGQFMWVQGFLAFLMALLVGPALISADLRNNGLPLYLARPFTRTEYVLGKMSVLVILMSAITWIPGLLLFGLQSYLLGAGWMREQMHLPFGIFAGSVTWILILSLVTLAVSAYVKWKPVARLVLLGLYVAPPPFAALVEGMFGTEIAYATSVWVMIHDAWASMFGTPAWKDFPVLGIWFSLFLIGGVTTLLLARRVRPLEIVK